MSHIQMSQTLLRLHSLRHTHTPDIVYNDQDIIFFITLIDTRSTHLKNVNIKLEKGFVPSTMLDLAMNPDDALSAPLNTTKLAPVTALEGKHTHTHTQVKACRCVLWKHTTHTHTHTHTHSPHLLLHSLPPPPAPPLLSLSCGGS